MNIFASLKALLLPATPGASIAASPPTAAAGDFAALFSTVDQDAVVAATVAPPTIEAMQPDPVPLPLSDQPTQTAAQVDVAALLTTAVRDQPVVRSAQPTPAAPLPEVDPGLAKPMAAPGARASQPSLATAAAPQRGASPSPVPDRAPAQTTLAAPIIAPDQPGMPLVAVGIADIVAPHQAVPQAVSPRDTPPASDPVAPLALPVREKPAAPSSMHREAIAAALPASVQSATRPLPVTPAPLIDPISPDRVIQGPAPVVATDAMPIEAMAPAPVIAAVPPARMAVAAHQTIAAPPVQPAASQSVESDEPIAIPERPIESRTVESDSDPIETSLTLPDQPIPPIAIPVTPMPIAPAAIADTPPPVAATSAPIAHSSATGRTAASPAIDAPATMVAPEPDAAKPTSNELARHAVDMPAMSVAAPAAQPIPAGAPPLPHTGPVFAAISQSPETGRTAVAPSPLVDVPASPNAPSSPHPVAIQAPDGARVVAPPLPTLVDATPMIQSAPATPPRTDAGMDAPAVAVTTPPQPVAQAAPDMPDAQPLPQLAVTGPAVTPVPAAPAAVAPMQPASLAVAAPQADAPAMVPLPDALPPQIDAAKPVRSEALSLLQLVRDQITRRPAAKDRVAPVQHGSAVAPTAVADNIVSLTAPPVATMPSVAPVMAPLTQPLADVGNRLATSVVDMGVQGQWIDGLARDIAGLSANGAQGSFQIQSTQLGQVQVDIRQGSDGADVSLTVASDAAVAALRQDSDRLRSDAALSSVRIAEIRIDRAPTPADAPRSDTGSQQGSAQSQSGNLSQGMNQGANQGRPQPRENFAAPHKVAADPAVLNHVDAREIAQGGGRTAGRARYA